MALTAPENQGTGQAAPTKQEPRAQDVKVQVTQAEARPPSSENLEKFYYPRNPDHPANSPAGTTGAAVDAALRAMKDKLIGSGIDTGEVRRMSVVRAGVLPLFVATGFATTAEITLGGVASAIPFAGVVSALLSPVVSMVNRVMGENAFSQAAKFMNRSEDRGLFSRLLHGGESRLVKGAFFKEDRNTSQLLRMYDQMLGGEVDPNTGRRINTRNQAEQDAWLQNMAIGSRDRIEWMIARGCMQELKAQMIDEHNMQLSDQELLKKERMHDAYRMAKALYREKIPTEGQRQIFRQKRLPAIMNTMEQQLWSDQTLRVAGVSGLKAAGAVALGMAGVPLIFRGLEFAGTGLAAIAGNIPLWLSNLGGAFAAAGDWVSKAWAASPFAGAIGGGAAAAASGPVASIFPGSYGVWGSRPHP